VPVLCADEVVHKLYSAGGAAVAPVGAAFPSAVVDGAIDRAALSKCVVGNEAAMKQLEGVVHPLVEQERAKFVQEVSVLLPPAMARSVHRAIGCQSVHVCCIGNCINAACMLLRRLDSWLAVLSTDPIN
jgi:hypothetical protein